VLPEFSGVVSKLFRNAAVQVRLKPDFHYSLVSHMFLESHMVTVVFWWRVQGCCHLPLVKLLKRPAAKS
jgi:hypothetical protein